MKLSGRVSQAGPHLHCTSKIPPQLSPPSLFSFSAWPGAEMLLSSSSVSSAPHQDVSASGFRRATPPTVHPQQPQQPTISKARATTSQPHRHQNDTYFSLSSFAPRSSGLFTQPFPVLLYLTFRLIGCSDTISEAWTFAGPCWTTTNFCSLSILLDDFFVVTSVTLLPPPGITSLRFFGVALDTDLFQASPSTIISGSTSTSVMFLLCAASLP